MNRSINDILLFMGLIFISLVASGFIFISIYDVENLEEIGPGGYLINGILSQVIVFFGSFVLFLRITKTDYKTLIWIKPLERKWVLRSLTILAVSYLIIFLLSYFNGLLELLLPNHPAIIRSQDISSKQAEVLLSFDGVRILYSIFVVSILPAIAEELVFRGFLLRKIFELKPSQPVAIGISALVFAVVHFQVLNFLPILFMGIVFGYVYMTSKNILYPMLMHFVFNASQVILAHY